MIQFVREIPIRIVIQKTLSHRRGFLFHVSAGFSGEVDSQSGMIVNLMDVDPWLSELQQQLQEQLYETDLESLNPLFSVILNEAWTFLADKSSKLGVSLVSLKFREERHFGFQRQQHETPEFYCPRFVELVPSLAEATLLKLTFFWQYEEQCEHDFAHESFLLLKPLGQVASESLLGSLSQTVGTCLKSGSKLHRILVENLVDGTKTEI